MKPGEFPLFDIRVNQIKRAVKETGAYQIYDERSTKAGRSFTVYGYSLDVDKQQERAIKLNKEFERQNLRTVNATVINTPVTQAGQTWVQYHVRVYVAIEDDEKMSDDEIYDLAMAAHRYSISQANNQAWAKEQVKEFLKGK